MKKERKAKLVKAKGVSLCNTSLGFVCYFLLSSAKVAVTRRVRKLIMEPASE